MKTTDAAEVEEMVEMTGMTKEVEEIAEMRKETTVTEPQEEPGSFYCWLINDRTGYKKLVSKDYAFRKTQGLFNALGIRIKPWKDTYTVKEIEK